ncbi:MAG: hypothetical protein M3Y09_18825 [Actinomycetota bacterium]|nr:hypothetical protein [Actinomycetota bacterium]
MSFREGQDVIDGRVTLQPDAEDRFTAVIERTDRVLEVDLSRDHNVAESDDD